MKQTIYLAFITMLLCSGCITNTKENQDAGVFITEPSNPQVVTPAQGWSQLERGIHAAWGSTHIRYLKDYIPQDVITDGIALTGWRNERVQAKIVLWSGDTVENIGVEVKLKGPDGKGFPEEVIKHFYVRNTITDEFLRGCGPREKDPTTARLMPDAFESLDRYSHPSASTRGVWVTMDIPEDTKAGVYRGKAIISVNGKTKKELGLNLTVQDMILPDPSDWAFHLDLWQNPYSVVRIENVDIWSEEHFKAMGPLYKMLSDAGQKCITATISHMPWGGQTLDPYESMVKRTRNEDGSWSFDYSVFDRWVDFMMELGIKKQINCYSLISWNELYHFYDRTTGRDSSLKLIPGDKDYEEFWAPFLIDFSEYLTQKQLLGITTLAMDERAPELMKPVIKMVKEYSPELKISMATDLKDYASDEIYDLSIGLKHFDHEEIVASRAEQGLITTVYVACQPSYPNTYSFSPPAESAWLGWFAYANKLDGVLRWAYNSWVEEPLVDTRFRRWPGGDAFMVYPGARSSIRFEMLRDGIEDFEKLSILRDKILNSSLPEKKSMLEKFENHSIRLSD